MPLTPQITLTATLLDYSGEQIGSAGSPAYLRIALCGWGQTLPRVPGTAMIGQVASWPKDEPYVGAQITVMLFGNDVITPAGTYYSISVLDSNKNVIQSGIYQFTGTETIDLSSAAQIVQPAPSPFGIKEFQEVAGSSGTTVTLASTPMPNTPVMVFRAGVKLSTTANDYTISGRVITFTAGYDEGDTIDVVYWTTTG